MKKFLITFTISLLIMISGVLALIIAVDPFFHYHKPLSAIGGYMDRAVYQTPGAAKHFDYDAVIVGSSMTENMHAKWFDEMGLNAVKLSYAGAEMKDYGTILEKVYEGNRDVKLIVMDINEFQLSSDADAVYQEYPKYLYDNNAFTDTGYLFNNDVFWMSVERVVDRLTDKSIDMDDSYTWEEQEHFSSENTYRMYQEMVDNYDEAVANGNPYILLSSEEIMQRTNDNLDCIIPFIEANPQTKFAIYYPPYSVLYWKEVMHEGRLEEVENFYRESMSRLMQYDNVDLFAFYDEEEIVTNLDRYRDLCHHDPAGNRFVFDCIKDTYCGEGNNANRNLLVEDSDIERVFEKTLDLVYNSK